MGQAASRSGSARFSLSVTFLCQVPTVGRVRSHMPQAPPIRVP